VSAGARARARRAGVEAALWNALAWLLFAANCWLLSHQLRPGG
jgi:hypothetical protein